MTSEFARETAVVARSTGVPVGTAAVFDATVHADWSVGNGPNGGFTAALLLRAALEHLGSTGAAMHARSFTAHLVGAPQVGPCELHVTTEKQGRTAAFLGVRLAQGDALLATAAVVCVAPRPEQEQYAHRTRPVVPSPAAPGARTSGLHLAPYLHPRTFPPSSFETNPGAQS